MINGKNLVAGNWESQSDSIKFQTINPKTQEALEVDFQQATSDQISRALEAASESFELVATISLTDRIRFFGVHSKRNATDSIRNNCYLSNGICFS